MKNQEITREPVHLIYRLHGSVPAAWGKKLSLEYETAKDEITYTFGPMDACDPAKLKAYEAALAEVHLKFQLKLDDHLDRKSEGPMYLADPRAKRIIVESWLFLEKTEPLEIDAISVMSNHVHVMLSHREELGVLWLNSYMTRHKRYTSHTIKKLLGIKTDRFWAKGYFDRLVRYRRYGTVLQYILNNPVKAGLSEDPDNWEGNYFARKI